VLLAAGWLSAATAQYWTGPFLLTGSGNDVNPFACKEFLAGGLTCLVWQKNDSECWNICSRFCNLARGNGWGAEHRITRDSAHDNVNPAVACLNDWQDHPSYWCVWERREGPATGSVMASFITFRDSWSPPVVLGQTIHTDGDSAMPGIITIEGSQADTVWVAWRNHDTSGTYVSYVYHAGDSWSSPRIAVAQDLRHARLGRYGEWYGHRPLLVWERAGDIWYSIYQSGAWSTPAQVAPSPSPDRAPDVVNAGAMGPSYVVWESERGGDTAIYITCADTMSLAQRVCSSVNVGRNWSPAGANIAFTTEDFWYCIPVWVSDRGGNPDIYACPFGFPWEGHVDLNPADDLSPVITCMGAWMGEQMAWVLWQSNRGQDWDIYGSYIYNTGVEERSSPHVEREVRGATTVRGVLWLSPSLFSLPGGGGGGLRGRAALLDASGRRFADLRPGVNDVRHLAPGVYFLRSEASVTRVVVAD
jgi:hypothetical protein